MVDRQINVPVLRTAYGTYVALEDYVKLQEKVEAVIELVNSLDSAGTERDIYEGTRQDILSILGENHNEPQKQMTLSKLGEGK